MICYFRSADIIDICIVYLVPSPNVRITSGNQIVGQSLTLQCNGTAVRGIISRVDIVWSSGGMELSRTNGTTPTTMGNSLVYTDSYTISQLSTIDEGRVIQCEVVINASPSVIASNSITLDVTGECFNACQFCMSLYISMLNCQGFFIGAFSSSLRICSDRNLLS